MLWVITQNKQSLMNVKDITVKGKNIEGFIANSFLGEWNKTLGRYESKERALEILNEIFMKIDKSEGIPVTFTMPES